MLNPTYPCPCCGRNAEYTGVKKDLAIPVNLNKYRCSACNLNFGTLEMEQNAFKFMLNAKEGKNHEDHNNRTD